MQLINLTSCTDFPHSIGKVDRPWFGAFAPANFLDALVSVGIQRAAVRV
jgi:hypothetical protein